MDRKSEKLKTLIYIPPLLNASDKGNIPYNKNEYKISKLNLIDLIFNFL